MNFFNQLKKNKRKWISFSLFLIVIFTILGIGALIFNTEKKDAEEYSRMQLTSITDLKIDQINSWRKERLFDAKALFNNASFIGDVKTFIADKGNKSAETKITTYLKHFLETQYHSVFLIDRNLNIRLSFPANDGKLDQFDKEMISEVISRHSIIFSDIGKDIKTDFIHFDVFIPLIINNTEIAVLLLRVDPYQYLYPLIQTWPVHSYSSEFLLVEQQNDSIVFLNELRHKKNTALKLKLPLSRTDILAVKAARGFEGFTEAYDYRNIKIMGLAKRVPGTKWLIIGKTDKEEVFSAVNKRIWLFYSFLFILFLFSLIVAFLYWKNLEGHQYAKLLEFQLENQKVKNSLEASEVKFQALFSSMNEGVALHKLVLDEKGEPVDYIIIDINPSFEKNTGIKVEKARGVLGSKLYNSNPPPYLDVYSNVSLTGKYYEFETYFPPLKRYFKISVSCPGYLMFATIFLDITDAKESEEKQKAFVLSLEQSNKELEQFAYVASHDLQEPLRMVSSFTQLLARKYKGQLSEEADGYINYAVDGAQRMQVLINDLLEYSRVTRKGKPFLEIDSSNALGQAIANLRKKIEDTDAIVIIGDMPSIFADEGQIVRLFQNLIDNAIKYKSDVPPMISISAHDNKSEWLFAIKDNGIGIDPEYNERIFEIFERLHSTSKYPGTGIGLAICRKIVERHRGKIWVEANNDNGVTFNFTINKRNL